MIECHIKCSRVVLVVLDSARTDILQNVLNVSIGITYINACVACNIHLSEMFCAYILSLF